MVIPEIGKTSRICLQSWMGTFVCSDENSLLVVNRPVAREWEPFELHRLDESYVTLKAHNRRFVCADGGGGSFLRTDREQPDQWERFGLFVDHSGLISLMASNGKYLRADHTGILLANSAEAKEREAFRLVAPDLADTHQTQVIVNVYKIYTAPVWHTGTVIDGTEYYFNKTNRVETCRPGNMGIEHHRTIARIVPHDLERVKSILDSVIVRWNDSRYDLFKHNCDFFTNDLLNSLGTSGLDQEYLNASGVAKGLRQLPGGSTLQELVVKWPIQDKRLDQSFLDDLKTLRNVPSAVANEVFRAMDKLENLGRRLRPPW